MESCLPKHYRLSIRPDLNTFRFEGSARVSLHAPVPVEEIVLNMLALEVRTCEVGEGEGLTPCTFSANPETEILHILLPREISGDFQLRIDYTGDINDKLAGFYRSSHTSGGEVRPLAVTQFQESSARMAFPCFDHPRYKATFDVEMVVDEHLTAISNGDIIGETVGEDGKKRVVFGTTPKMSTYLLFFGVGHFEWARDEKDRRVRAAAMPGAVEGLHTGLDFGRKSLQFCEDYFGIPYPMSKLDLIAVPDFAFGAMENWGAVVFRENLLLFDPEKTSQAGLERICEVIAHEIVHQWFGNLVSPVDWKYLWLNESFATFFAHRILDHFCPQWRVWDQFLHSQTAVAMTRDALWETPAIEIPGGDAHVVINAATAPIIYNKGAGILNQMQGYVGEEGFRRGLAHYLKTHAYDCTESSDLWEAYSASTDKPVTRLMKGWVEQPGFPVVTVRKAGTALTLRQERFTYLAGKEGGSLPPAAVWPVPLSVKTFTENGESSRFDILMDKGEVGLHIGPDVTALKINAGQTGFYRVHYTSDDMLDALGKRVADKSLPPADRWGLQEDLFAMARGGRIPLVRYLDFLTVYESEEDFLPVIGIAGNLHLASLVTGGGLRDRMIALGRKLLEAVLDSIGYSPGANEANTTRMLRDAILFRAVMFGSDTARARGRETFQKLLTDGEVHPDIQRSAMQIGAWLSPRPALDWFRKRLKTSDSEHERANILMALGCLSDEAVLKEALDYALAHVPQRNRHLPLVSCGANPKALSFMWDWMVSHMPDLETFHPILFERVIDALVPVCGLGREDTVRAFFDDYMSGKKTCEATIRIALEFLAVNERMRKQ